MLNIAVSCPPGEARDIARRYFKIALNNYDESKSKVRETANDLMIQDDEENDDALNQVTFLYKV